MNTNKNILPLCCFLVIAILFLFIPSFALGDLPEIKKKGALRHLGIPYANFITGSADGMDVEIVTLFARQLKVKYEFVKTTWADVIGDLTGKRVKARGEEVEILGEVPIRGDMIASGLTVLPWRAKVVYYSTPTFPTQVWLVARADSTMKPIQPSGDIFKDIHLVKGLLMGRKVMAMANTCLDPSLYHLHETGASISLYDGNLNELAPAVINGDAEATLLDVPDALVALEKWPGKIKIIGPISPEQEMACAFNKESPKLREEFNTYMHQCKKDGTYLRIVKKYYPSVVRYYPGFFEKK